MNILHVNYCQIKIGHRQTESSGGLGMLFLNIIAIMQMTFLSIKTQSDYRPKGK